MSKDLWAKAEELATRPYLTLIKLDKTTDGEEIYTAENPDLPGCISQGASREDAIDNLDDARVDYIYFLLEDGLEVPSPRPIYTTINTGAEYSLTLDLAPSLADDAEIHTTIQDDTIISYQQPI